jgi:predicted nucleic acid-binding Zn ribbon protein
MNTCVCCGKEIPEGRQVCFKCSYDYTSKEKKDKQSKEYEDVTEIILSRQPVATYEGGSFYV